MSSGDVTARNPMGRLRTLGGCWVAYGVFRLIVAICLFIYSGTATLMFGALLNRSEEHTSELQSPRNISYAVFCL